jgi:carboxylesterase
MAIFRKCLLGFAWIVAVLLVIIALMFLIPPVPVRFTPSATPCQTYEESIRRFNDLLKATPPEVREICRPYLLTHGSKTAQVLVLLHGLTNCPEQYRKLAEELYAQGYNVLVPLTPYHGRENRLTDALEHLTPEDLLQFSDQALAIAHGLGDKVTVAGLSVNGVTAAWYAQNTQLADRAILISPFVGIHGIPRAFTPGFANFMSRIPNIFFWWNPKLKQNIPGPFYAYPRAPTKPIAEILQLAEEVIHQAAASPPKTKEITVVYSKADMTISRKTLAILMKAWKKNTKITVYEFPEQDGVPHDMIDPNQPNEKIATVYPVLIKLFAQP